MNDVQLLDARGISKNYGAVAALRDASLSLKPGEVHALMGANGAGKSTLVKILTGAVRPDGGQILIRGQSRKVHSPAEARRTGLVSVYQEPAIIPDLDVLANLQLTDTPVAVCIDWVQELGISGLNLRETARDLPLATLRILDLARALAIGPDVLLLDEMTAALPVDLAERVLDVVRRQSKIGRSVIFISHRLLEISSLCDRATVLRDGVTVGTVDIEPGVEDTIVNMMLGETFQATERTAKAAEPEPASESKEKEARLSVVNLRAGSRLESVSFDLKPGEVLGVVALEGQGQDELFSVLSGSDQPAGGVIEVDGKPVQFRHPADAIAKGMVYVPSNRVDALLMQRSVRENIALPFSAKKWGLINAKEEDGKVDGAIERLQIDTRAQGEVQRLSGGNQQKVTIARWIATGLETMLCFDPTRGIDIRTKHEIYALLRELAAQGSSILLYTSELEEVQLACDRAIVIYRGEVVDTLPAELADEATLMRCAYGLPSTADAETGPVGTTSDLPKISPDSPVA